MECRRRNGIKIVAIKEAIHQWRWLLNNPGKVKYHYFDTYPEVAYGRYGCSLCTWYNDTTGGKKIAHPSDPVCPRCPLSQVGLDCHYPNDNEWHRWNFGDKSLAARNIYNGLRRALRRAENE